MKIEDLQIIFYDNDGKQIGESKADVEFGSVHPQLGDCDVFLLKDFELFLGRDTVEHIKSDLTTVVGESQPVNAILMLNKRDGRRYDDLWFEYIGNSTYTNDSVKIEEAMLISIEFCQALCPTCDGSGRVKHKPDGV